MPEHIVFLAGFWMDETEVTNAQYATCVQAGNCTPPRKPNSYTHAKYYGNSEFDNFPVTQVDWSQARTYCAWAGRRPPTEAEWEKAARGVTPRTYPWEGEAKGEYFANFSIYQVGDTTEVRHYPPGVSPDGIFDMAGNVYEWVADWYANSYYSTSPQENARAGNRDNESNSRRSLVKRLDFHPHRLAHVFLSRGLQRRYRFSLRQAQ